MRILLAAICMSSWMLLQLPVSKAETQDEILRTSLYQKTIIVPETWTSSLACLKIDREIYEQTSGDLTSIRILGEEIRPYALVVADKTPVSVQKLESEIFRNPPRERFLLDLGFSGIPHQEILLETTATNFFRTVKVYSGNVPDQLRQLKEDAIYSYYKGAVFNEQLLVSYPETRERYLAVELVHYDDQPIGLENCIIRGNSRLLFFMANPGENLTLYYGGPRKESPHYDFAKVYSALDPSAQPQLTLSSSSHNPRYRPTLSSKTREWQQWLLWISLGIAAFFLSAIAMRTLKAGLQDVR